jgi:tripartite ATP-independent transporter DctM subunit
MSAVGISVVAIAAMLVLLALRVPLGVALGAVSLTGLFITHGPTAAMGALGDVPYDFVAHWSLAAIPMFLLMGAVAYHAGLTGSLLRAARNWLDWLPGGLAIATTAASAGFAAACGSSVVSVAAMSRLAVPEMIKLGYDKGLATGCVAAAGTLAALIPPSILMVIFGWMAEAPVGKLLIAGIVPGLLTAVVYGAMIALRCIVMPELAPKAGVAAGTKEKLRSLVGTWPLLALMAGVIGGIYTGFATATEAAALGALLAFVIALVTRQLTRAVIRESFLDTLKSSASIFFIVIGAVLLTRFLALSGLPMFLAQEVKALNLDPTMLVVVVGLIYLVLGMFLETLGLLLLTLPILIPIFKLYELDMIWIGVLIVKFIEIGMLTPPIGMHVFVIKTTVGSQVGVPVIFRGLSWFVVADLLTIGLLIAFPGLSTWLPSVVA